MNARQGDTVAVMVKHVRRWCIVGGLALGCAGLSAVRALPVPPEPASTGAAEYRWQDPAGARGEDGLSRPGERLTGGRAGVSAAPPASVEPSDNRSAATPPASAAASHWMLRWTVWLQDYLLTCGFLV